MHRLIIIPWLWVDAMAIYPFILLKAHGQKHSKVLINHEKIHHRQQIELLIVPFYIFYLLNYLVNLIRYKNHRQAYLNMLFEKEAYQNEKDLSYLGHRKWFAWWRL